MVILGKSEILQRHDVGLNRSTGVLFQGVLGCHGLLALFFVVIKDRIFVLRCAGLPGVIVAVPQGIQQLTIGELFPIKIHLYTAMPLEEITW